MARQSIVDFFKDAQTTPHPATAAAHGISGVEAEKAYVELAKPVLDALSAGTPVPEGELFKHVDASNIGQFRAAIEVMRTRGLVQVVGLNQPFNEPVYGLASGVGKP